MSNQYCIGQETARTLQDIGIPAEIRSHDLSNRRRYFTPDPPGFVGRDGGLTNLFSVSYSDLEFPPLLGLNEASLYL